MKIGTGAGLRKGSSSSSNMAPEFDACHYMELQSLSAKTKRIQKKEFLELFSQGQYFPPGGCTVFSENNSSTLYIYGGARAAKPGHWALSNYLFQIQTEKFNKTESSASFHQVLSFKMFNHTTSKTSQFTKLVLMDLLNILQVTILRGSLLMEKIWIALTRSSSCRMRLEY